MKSILSLMLIASAGLLVSCAATTPPELLNARQAYNRASAGPAERLAPAELHQAKEALDQAEKSFVKDPNSYHTKDLAYAAERKANLAETRAAIASAKGSTAQANKDFRATQGDIMKETKQELNQTRTDLAASERAGEMSEERLSMEQRARRDVEARSADKQMAAAERLSMEQQAGRDAEKRSADKQIVAAEQLSVEQQARRDAEMRSADKQMAAAERLSMEQQARRDVEARSADKQMAAAERLSMEQQARRDAEKRTDDAQAALVNLAAVQEARGLVITLSGSVLFASNKSALLPAAQTRLTQVADALMATKDRRLTVEGHTDSQGTANYNLDLSQRRAEAVRAYLIAHDYPADQIQARGIGKGRPVATNANPEGRANNRRVEIIIEPEVTK